MTLNVINKNILMLSEMLLCSILSPYNCPHIIKNKYGTDNVASLFSLSN